MSRPIDPRLVRAVPPVRRLLATLAGLDVVGALLTVTQAVLLAELLVAIVLHGRHGHELLRVGLLYAVVGAGRALLGAIQEWLVTRASGRVRATLRRSVLTAVTRLGPTWTARQPAGLLVTAAGPGLEGLDGYLTRAVPALVAAGVVPVIVLVRIGVADLQSALILIATLPLVPVFMALVGVTTHRRMQVQYTALARLAGHFLDLVQGLTTLKVYGQAHRQVETVRRATDEHRRRTLHTLKYAFLSGLVLDLIATLSVAVVAVDVGLRLRSGRLGLQTALVVLLLAPELFAPLRAIGAQHHASEEGQVAASAALDVLDAAALLEPGDRVPVVPLAVPSTGSLLIRGLSIGYPGRETPALDGIDLTIRAGSVVAVEGSSGGGKSTLLAVLLRFVESPPGTVLVGGSAAADPVDLAGLDPDTWRSDTAWAPQLPRPTQADVAAEVALGDPTAGAAEIRRAIADCAAPRPDTPLGEDGGRVSAGQRRRVALARALLRARAVRDAGGVPLVLLDEPSEDLDVDTEQVVAAVVSGLAGWATVLVVTHSPRLAEVADRRILIAAGRIVADIAQAACRPRIGGPAPVAVDAPAASTSMVALPPRASLRTLVPARVPGTARLGPGGRRLLGAALLSGATGLAGLALTASSVWLIARAAEHPNVQALAIAVVGVRTFALAKAVLRYVERLVGHDGALRLLADVRARVFAALEPLAPGGLAGFRRGDLLRRFVSDVDGAQEGLVRAVVPFAGAVLTAAGAITLAALVAPVAGLILAAGLAVALLAAPALTRQVAGDGAARAAAAGLRDERTTACLDGLAELVAYGAAADAVAGVAAADETVVRAARRPGLAAAVGVGLTGFAAAATLPLVLLAGAALAAAGTRSPVTIAVLAACVLAGFDALVPLPAAVAAWAGFRGGLDRVAAVLASPPPLAEPTVPVAVPVGPIGLAARGLTVAPAAGAPIVVRDASLSLRPGQRVALVGPSGCGKSTLLTAALRLLPVAAGRFELTSGPLAAGPGAALADLRAADVPPLVAGSLQGDHVFDASLRDNLRVVRPEATDADLDAVAARAGLRTFLDGLPRGWSTPAGRDGSALSGGERQRLLLARALLFAPAVLVLDEPTAHLDTETERAVLADLLAGTRGQTVLMSTHRHLGAGQVDAVIVISGGTTTSTTELGHPDPEPWPVGSPTARVGTLSPYEPAR
jgi:ATP-binding cassette subfamily C protein CydCD